MAWCLFRFEGCFGFLVMMNWDDGYTGLGSACRFSVEHACVLTTTGISMIQQTIQSRSAVRDRWNCQSTCLIWRPPTLGTLTTFESRHSCEPGIDGLEEWEVTGFLGVEGKGCSSSHYILTHCIQSLWIMKAVWERSNCRAVEGMRCWVHTRPGGDYFSS